MGTWCLQDHLPARRRRFAQAMASLLLKHQREMLDATQLVVLRSAAVDAGCRGSPRGGGGLGKTVDRGALSPRGDISATARSARCHLAAVHGHRHEGAQGAKLVKRP